MVSENHPVLGEPKLSAERAAVLFNRLRQEGTIQIRNQGRNWFQAEGRASDGVWVNLGEASTDLAVALSVILYLRWHPSPSDW